MNQGETIISSEEAEENDVSLLNTWSYYARSEAEAQGTVENGEACVNVGGETTLFRVQDVGLNYIGFPLVAGQSYRLFFEAYCRQAYLFPRTRGACPGTLYRILRPSGGARHTGAELSLHVRGEG